MPGVRLHDGEVRAGGRVLGLLSDPVYVSILRRLASGPLPTLELSDRVGATSRTTLFARLRDLEDLGVIRREKHGGSPPVTRCMLSPGGAALLPVARRFAIWLSRGPGEARGRKRMDDILAIKALALGWDTTALRWFAEESQTVTDLTSRCSPEATHHDVRRARHALSGAGLIESAESTGRGRPFTLSIWTRAAAGPLAAAARWERDFLIGASGQLSATEGETLLLLALSQIEVLPGAPSGTCALRLDSESGIRVVVEQGRVVSSTPDSEDGCPSCVCGSTRAWLDTLLDGRREGLRMRGSALRLLAMITAGLQQACL